MVTTHEEKLVAAKTYLKERFKGGSADRGTRFKYTSGPTILVHQTVVALTQKLRRVK